MSPELIQFLSQIPLVAAFIWFVLEWSKRTQIAMDKRDQQMQTFLSEQREQDRNVLSRLVSQMDQFTNLLENHDKKTDVAVAKMEERTRPVRKSKVVEIED